MEKIGEKRGQPAIGKRLQCQAQDDHAPVPTRYPCDVRQIRNAGEARAQALVVAHHDERRAGCLDIRKQKIKERLLPVAVERGSRLVGDNEFGRADQRPRRRYALLLPDAEARRR